MRYVWPMGERYGTVIRSASTLGLGASSAREPGVHHHCRQLSNGLYVPTGKCYRLSKVELNFITEITS